MPGIINGRGWLGERRRFLREELSKGPDEEQRAAIEAELAAVDQQLARSRHRWFWFLWGARPPE